MEQKEMKIEIPEGYEIDKEKSSFEKIVFKKKKIPFSAYAGNHPIKGYYISAGSDIVDIDKIILYDRNNNTYNKNVFASEKLAKKALAMAQLSQIINFDLVLRRYQVVDIKIKKPSFMCWTICYTKEKSFSIARIEARKDNVFDDYSLVAFEIPSDTFLKNKLKESLLNFIDENEQILKDYFMID